jgi:uncharacterized phage protein (TIGR02218 family)
MSFDDTEKSLAGGKPIRLYLFERGLQSWAYCTADRDITFASTVYRSTAISDNGRRYTGEPQSDAFEVTAPSDLPVAMLFRGLGPSSEITLTVRDVHHEAIISDARIVYIGSITVVRRTGLDRVKIICQSSEAALRQTGLRMTWGRGCQHEHYGRGCGVNRDLFKTESVINEMNGATVSNGAFAAFPDNYFAGGFIEWSVGTAQFDRRGIESHSGSTLTLLGGTSGLALNMAINVYAGCDRTIQTCKNKFSNDINYPGAPGMPGISPFDGNSVF